MNRIIQGDCLEVLKTLPDGCVNMCVTSPPYWGLRDYGVEGQLGLESTPDEYVAKMVEIFREVKRVLRDDGTLWLNLGDSFAGGKVGGNDGVPDEWQRPSRANKANIVKSGNGLKHKDLVGIPWRVAFALQADGWYLRSDIIWAKPNPMPESVTDRPTKAHEYMFLLSKSARYYYDAEAVKEQTVTKDTSIRDRDNTKLNNTPGRTVIGGLKENNYNNRNLRSVWTIATQPYSEAHFATFPEALVEPCIKAGCPDGGVVLDPFMGSGTVALVALKYQRKFLGIELNPEYIKMAEKRIEFWKRQGELFEEVDHGMAKKR